jgi:hypothetical protein
VKRIIWILLAVAGVVVCLVLYQCIGPKRPALVFHSLVSLPSAPLSANTLAAIQIEFGKEANQARDYPASFASNFHTPCSGTLIGRDTVLTSAHCVGLGEGVPVSLTISGKNIKGHCRAHPDYQSYNLFHDVALCKLTTPAPGSGFEYIATKKDIALVDVGKMVRLTGWADFDPPDPLARWWRRLRRCLGFGSAFKIGAAIVQRRETVLFVEGVSMYGGPAVAEIRDSGGAAYVGKDPHRTIVGLNACGGDGCYGAQGNPKITVLANLTEETTADFITDWIVKKKASVCGINSTDGCRAR